MKQILLSFLGGLLLLCSHANAQSREVTGKVTSKEDGSPLPGVTIFLKGTNRGTTTNSDGEYSISASSGATLVFSFIGFIKHESQVGSQTLINISLATDETELQEAIITSLGIARDKKALGYSVQEIKGEKLALARDADSTNNVRDFFEKPVSSNSNIAFAKAGENYSSKISYTYH
ncbi:carboxypeptidase-like regulatory domain-containing protein [Dyadobacter pollutisoli]|jgi:hypothetical protein|uniref:Carboxypeptidase-like regulatory domain-containing protein n=1 Tax=Dyadobacter pollutisoli TaxID=2910158 RepID=A0A9E8NDR6_9BACT|nr:carboxypeptidase-like regulatory domain-containing protein [Dyadobacter pollutisoli]WAC12324.1 carboxypeptidase-like regulatory domain-containing protein [Dyadobacter pollutisoli]